MPLVAAPDWDENLNSWVDGRGGGKAFPTSFKALGWWREDPPRITGALIFHSANSVNCEVNVALERGINPRGLLTCGLWYAFKQLALRRLTFRISAANLSSIKLATDLGSIHEASLRGALPEGDLHIYALFPDKCPLWRKIRGQVRQRTPST